VPPAPSSAETVGLIVPSARLKPVVDVPVVLSVSVTVSLALAAVTVIAHCRVAGNRHAARQQALDGRQHRIDVGVGGDVDIVAELPPPLMKLMVVAGPPLTATLSVSPAAAMLDGSAVPVVVAPAMVAGVSGVSDRKSCALSNSLPGAFDAWYAAVLGSCGRFSS
jgi:hypothetical protein